MLVMPALPRKETEKRLLKMAKALVDMEQGVYEWPDGRKAVRADGSPVISKVELVRVGGYAPYRTGHQSRWFEDPYFKRQVALEKARREANLPDILDSQPINLLKLGREMVEEARRRLIATPEDFTVSQLVTFGPQCIKMGLEIEKAAEPHGNGNGNTKIDELNAYVVGTVVNMDPESREELLSTVTDASDARLAKLQQQIDALQAKEEDDGDVIDAEISPEPS